MDLARFILQERRKQKVTQENLAELSGVSLKTIKRLENNTVSTKVNTLNKVVFSLGYTIDLVKIN